MLLLLFISWCLLYTEATPTDLCNSSCLNVAVNAHQRCVHVTAECGIDTFTMAQPTVAAMPPPLMSNDTGACCSACMSRTSPKLTNQQCIDGDIEPFCITSPFCADGEVVVRKFALNEQCRSPTKCPESFEAGACCRQCINLQGRVVPGKSACRNVRTSDLCPPPDLPTFTCSAGQGEQLLLRFTSGQRCRSETQCPRARPGRMSACCLQCANDTSISDCMNVASQETCDTLFLQSCANTTRFFLSGQKCRGSQCPPLTCNAIPSDVMLSSHCVYLPTPAINNGITIRCNATSSSSSSTLFSMCFPNSSPQNSGADIVVATANASATCRLPHFFGCNTDDFSELVVTAAEPEEPPSEPPSEPCSDSSLSSGEKGVIISNLVISGLTLIIATIMLGLTVTLLSRFKESRASKKRP